MPSNEDRANLAEIAVQAFADEPSSAVMDEETLIDLIRDLGHCARQNLGLSRKSVVRLYEIGIGAWSAEDANSDGNPSDNDPVQVFTCLE